MAALLAELEGRVRGPDWRARPVVWFDFDHPARIRLDPASRMNELLRQLAPHPGFDGGLAPDYRGYLSMWRDFLDNSGMQGVQLLVIGDTFEEVLYRVEDERMQLLQFLRDLGRPEQIDHIRVICAARGLPDTPDWKPDRQLR